MSNFCQQGDITKIFIVDTGNTGSTGTDIYVTGGTYSNGTLILKRNDGVNVSISGFSTTVAFTGNTSASCISNLYISNLHGCSPITVWDPVNSLSYISATTYYGDGSNLSGIPDYYVTGGTYSNGTLTLNRQNGSVTIPGFLTGGTGTGIDTYVTGFTYNNSNKLTLSRNQGQPDLNIYINVMSGLTINGFLAQGLGTAASGQYSHAEGNGTNANGNYSHAEGQSTQTIGGWSHAEGFGTQTNGNYSHAEGISTTSSGAGSHAEGSGTTASGIGSHAEGLSTQANGIGSHSQGFNTIANGEYSFASGSGSTASGIASFIHSSRSVVTGDRSVVLGGQGISGTSNDFVYVPSLNINSQPTLNNSGTQILTRNSGTGNIEYRDASTISGGTSIDTFVTGFTYSNNNLSINQNQGQSPLSVTINNFTGLTVNGSLSASTYLGLPIDPDYYVTGGTYSNGVLTLNRQNGSVVIGGLLSADTYVTGFTFNTGTYDLTIFQNNGVAPLIQNLGILAGDITVTGGTYNPNNGVATFYNNVGGSFQVPGFLTGFTDIYLSSGTYNPNTGNLTLTRTDNVSVTVTGFTDYYVTGGTYSNGSLTLNRQNGSVTIPGFLTGITGIDTYVTGFTYNDANRLTISQNGGQPPLNVFINTFTGLTTDYADFNLTATTTNGIGRLKWNDTDGTLDLGLKGGNVTLQIGQEQVVRVVNKTGADLLESQYKVVRIRSQAEGGSQGQRLAIVLAQANNDPNSVDTLGIVTENIDNNQEGFITSSGLVRNINTTGSLQSETWLDGDVLYLSPITAGELTKVKPIAPQHTVIMGYVVYAHVNNGKIFVKVDNGYELDELHNVKISGETNNQVLSYDSVQSVWVNRTLPAFITGFTDNFVTGGTYSSGTLTLNRQNGSVIITGFTTSSSSGGTGIDTYVTGFTYSNNNLSINQNQGQSPLSVTINNFTGLTVNGSLSASTYLGLPSFTFTGNTSASCISDIYVSNLHGCSPITIHDSIKSIGSSATGITSFAFGNTTVAAGDYSHAEGESTIAIGISSHAEGSITKAVGDYSHAEGDNTQAKGNYSHTEGQETIASGFYSHAEGYLTKTIGDRSHAEGNGTISGAYAYLVSGYSGNNIVLNPSYGNVTSEFNTTITVFVYDSVGGGGEVLNFSATSYNNITSATTVVVNNIGLTIPYYILPNPKETGNFNPLNADQNLGINSHAEGYYTQAIGGVSHVEGYRTQAIGYGSHAEGGDTQAIGEYSHVEGGGTIAIGNSSHAEGDTTQAIGNYSHAEGSSTITTGTYSHAEGDSAQAIGGYSHAEGYLTKTIGDYSHTEGNGTLTGQYFYTTIGVSSGVITLDGTYGDVSTEFTTTGIILEDSGTFTWYQIDQGTPPYFDGAKTIITLTGTSVNSGTNVGIPGVFQPTVADILLGSLYSHAEGEGTIAIGYASHAEGKNTTTIGAGSHAEGGNKAGPGPQAIGDFSHAEGDGTTAQGEASHAEGLSTTAIGGASHAEGESTTAIGGASHAEGESTTSSGVGSHAEGGNTEASGQYSHTEGVGTEASGTGSHAEGYGTKGSGSIGDYSHTEGYQTTTNGDYSHTEGRQTTTNGDYSHAEGYLTSTNVKGLYSHAEGHGSQAGDIGSHAEGYFTQANGNYSHSQGTSTVAGGDYSFASGSGSTAQGVLSFVHSINSVAAGEGTVVLGGVGISGTTPNMVYVSTLNINSTPVSNSGGTQVLVRNSSTGDIEYNSNIQAQIDALKVEEVNLQDIGTGLPASTYTIVLNAKYARTINELTVIAGAGTCTLTMNINNTPVTGISGVSVTTTGTTYTTTATNVVAVGNTVTMVTTSNSGLANLQATIKTTR